MTVISRKTKTIKLNYPIFNRDPTIGPGDPNMYGYSVEQVTDSTVHNPGDFLLKADVDKLCADDAWKVVVTKVGQ